MSMRESAPSPELVKALRWTASQGAGEALSVYEVWCINAAAWRIEKLEAALLDAEQALVKIIDAAAKYKDCESIHTIINDYYENAAARDKPQETD